MNYIISGNTGLKVSTLCLGTMNYGSKGFFSLKGDLGQQEVDAQVQKVMEAGICQINKHPLNLLIKKRDLNTKILKTLKTFAMQSRKSKNLEK